MLVLSRKQQQEILVGENIKITVLKVKGNTVRLGIEAPKEVRVLRAELPTDKSNAPMAEVTVVFNNDSDDSENSNLKLVPFPGKKDSRSNESSSIQTKSVAQPTNRVSEIADTVSFRQQLPQSLNHNRLKQIVDELTSK